MFQNLKECKIHVLILVFAIIVCDPLISNCPSTTTAAATTVTTRNLTFNDHLLYHGGGGFAKKFWSCSQPNYFPNKIHSTWFPYFCLHTDNLVYLGYFYEKHPKLLDNTNMQKERQRVRYGFGFRGSKSDSRYNWKHDKFGSTPSSTTASTDKVKGTDAAVIIHEIVIPPINNRTNSTSKILGGSKCFRSLGLLRPGLSSYLPCIIQLNIDINSNCDAIRRDLDAAVEILLDIHLKTESNGNFSLAFQTSHFIQIQRNLVNISGVFAHESPLVAPGELTLHCSNLTLGVEVITTFYNNRPIGLRINYMKRDDQFVSPYSARRLHLTSTTSDVNKTLVSKYSRFWSNILYTECPADFCWRDLLRAAKPAAAAVESIPLLLPYEAELFMVSCFGALGALALLLLHEFMRTPNLLNDVLYIF